MNAKNNLDRFVSALIGFVERASQKDATPEEIAALPEVAQVIVNLHQVFESIDVLG